MPSINFMIQCPNCMQRTTAPLTAQCRDCGMAICETCRQAGGLCSDCAQARDDEENDG